MHFVSESESGADTSRQGYSAAACPGRSRSVRWRRATSALSAVTTRPRSDRAIRPFSFSAGRGGWGGGVVFPPLPRMLAARGYPRLGIGYFAAPGVPPTLANIPLEYFER